MGMYEYMYACVYERRGTSAVPCVGVCCCVVVLLCVVCCGGPCGRGIHVRRWCCRVGPSEVVERNMAISFNVQRRRGARGACLLGTAIGMLALLMLMLAVLARRLDV
jgi:hypothetical protein